MHSTAEGQGAQNGGNARPSKEVFILTCKAAKSDTEHTQGKLEEENGTHPRTRTLSADLWMTIVPPVDSSKEGEIFWCNVTKNYFCKYWEKNFQDSL